MFLPLDEHAESKCCWRKKHVVGKLAMKLSIDCSKMSRFSFIESWIVKQCHQIIIKLTTFLCFSEVNWLKSCEWKIQQNCFKILGNFCKLQEDVCNKIDCKFELSCITTFSVVGVSLLSSLLISLSC